MLQTLLNLNVTIKRRGDSGTVARDSLGNPIYGAPTSGSTWTTVYSSASVRLAFGRKTTVFASTGERVVPSGTMYFNTDLTILAQDRVITPDGIEYVVVGVVPGTIVANVVDHFEAELILP